MSPADTVIVLEWPAAKTSERRREMCRPARQDLVTGPVGFGDLDWIGCLKVAVEIVEGENLHLDRPSLGNGRRRRDLGGAGTKKQSRDRGPKGRGSFD